MLRLRLTNWKQLLQNMKAETKRGDRFGIQGSDDLRAAAAKWHFVRAFLTPVTNALFNLKPAPPLRGIKAEGRRASPGRPTARRYFSHICAAGDSQEHGSDKALKPRYRFAAPRPIMRSSKNFSEVSGIEVYLPSHRARDLAGLKTPARTGAPLWAGPATAGR